jgi:hypothetical protein
LARAREPVKFDALIDALRVYNIVVLLAIFEFLAYGTSNIMEGIPSERAVVNRMAKKKDAIVT